MKIIRKLVRAQRGDQRDGTQHEGEDAPSERLPNRHVQRAQSEQERIQAPRREVNQVSAT
jgi:hypothetical protein